ncbi:MAG: L,D-transpeptidase [Bacteroidales bacterium]|nr:L,D-transpeptidase [Bacteroidales bacterium]
MEIKELIDTFKNHTLKLIKGLLAKLKVQYRKFFENEQFIYFFGLFKQTVKVSGIALCVILVFLVFIPLLQEMAIALKPEQKQKMKIELTEKEIKVKIRKIERENQNLQRKLNWKTPWQPYLVVNSTINEFSLYRGNKLIREGICSTGSYIMLKAADERKWVFKTPRGVFRIQGKVTSPVWIKPDWAFVEEGLPVPSKNANERYEYGVLGDYALSLGHGYLIHGTLYQRFLGLPVTHGCIRMGDEDLKAVYNTLDIGSKVYIY